MVFIQLAGKVYDLDMGIYIKPSPKEEILSESIPGYPCPECGKKWRSVRAQTLCARWDTRPQPEEE